MLNFERLLLIIIIQWLAVDTWACEIDTDVDLSGDEIEFIVPFGPGGGTDAWVKSVVPHFKRFLPGNPKIKIRHIPGSNSTKATNWYANSTSRDGSSVLVTATSNHLSYLLGDSRAHYDFSDWRAFLAFRAGAVVYTKEQPGVENIRDLLDKNNEHLLLASMSVTSDDLYVLLALQLLNVDFSSIFGSPGRGAARKLFERGETNIDFQTTVAYMTHVKPDEQSGKVVPLFSLGQFDKQLNYIRDPVFPNLPNVAEVYEYVHGVPPSGEAWDAWLSLYRAGNGSVKTMVLPKDTPETIVRAFDKAAGCLVDDPEFKMLSQKTLGTDSMLTAEAAQDLLQSRFTISEKTRLWIVNWIFETYGVRL